MSVEEILETLNETSTSFNFELAKILSPEDNGRIRETALSVAFPTYKQHLILSIAQCTSYEELEKAIEDAMNTLENTLLGGALFSIEKRNGNFWTGVQGYNSWEISCDKIDIDKLREAALRALREKKYRIDQEREDQKSVDLNHEIYNKIREAIESLDSKRVCK